MVTAQLADGRDLTPAQTAAVIAATLAAQPLFCDLLTHVPLSLEGEVSVERARRYKTNAFAAFDDIVDALTASGTMTTAQVHDLLVTATALAANLWQLAHPTPTLVELYKQNPTWCKFALDFEPRLTRLLQATAIGLASGEKDPITV